MAQAYDFALDKIGMEIMSYQVHRSESDQSTGVYIYMCVFKFVITSVISLIFPFFQIWVDYINFLKGV